MNSRVDIHHIQRGVILSLAERSPQRFSELQPPRVPNNAFSYHLKRLLESGYVESVEVKAGVKGYVLTRKSLKIVSAQDDASNVKRIASPTLITIHYVVNSSGEVLLINRSKDPFQGWYGLPSGGIHAGETIDEAARRELHEKTGIEVDITKMQPVGVLDFQYRQAKTGDLFNHAVGFVFRYDYSDDDASILNDKKTNYGQLSWSKMGRKYILPEVKVVAEMSAVVESSKVLDTTVAAEAANHTAGVRSVVLEEPLSYLVL